MKRRTFLKLAAGMALAAGPGAQPAGAAVATLMNQEAAGLRNRDRSTVIGRDGMLCTSQPLASIAGLDVLKAGGNAIDAIICANATLGVVEPMNCGPGGDLFAIVWWEQDKKLYGLNASGRAPYGWNLAEAEKRGLKSIPAYSPLAWNVPGCVSGWEALRERFGTRSAAQALEAPIHYARDGFAVSSVIAGDWPFSAAKFPTLAATFLPDGRAPRYGEIFTNPDIAAFYGILAKEGFNAFYKGEPAERIARFSKENDGYLSRKDFEEHQATWVDPVSTGYRGFNVWEIPPNGQGISVLQMLNMLECFDIGAMAPNAAEPLHLFIEAKKLAYEDRAKYYADMDFAEVPLKELISKEYGRARAKEINPKRASRHVTAGDPSGKDTVYLCAADQFGNMVSLIQSTYHGWGSHIVPDRLGFALQNRGVSFSLDPGHRNRLEPHKRPFHTIIPAFLTKAGAPVMAFGVMGGDFQPQGHVQILMNMIDFGMSPQRAGDQPRVEHSGSSSPSGGTMREGGTVNLEAGIGDEVRKKLEDWGHHLGNAPDVFGGYQAIWREEAPRRYFGGSDPRKDGCAATY